MTTLRTFTLRFFILLNTVIAVLFLLTCCNAFLHPDKWWFISLLAFFFPLFLILLLIFLIFWMVVHPRYVLISIVCLLIGWRNIHAFFGFSLAGHDFSKKDSASIRIMTWNVRSWDEFSTKKAGSSGHRFPMLNLVDRQQADILCFQEFYESTDTAKSNIRYIRDQLHFPYYFFSRDYHGNKYQNGVIIFSKFPILARYLWRFTAGHEYKNRKPDCHGY